MDSKKNDPNTWWESAAEIAAKLVAPAPAAKIEISNDDRARLSKLFGSAVVLAARLANFAELSEEDQSKARELFPDFEAPRFTSPAKAERDQAEALAFAKVQHEREAFEAERTAELVARNESDEWARHVARTCSDETRRLLAAALASDVHAALAPLWKAFREEPSRLVSLRIADTWLALEARCERELGAVMNAHVLCVTLLELFDQRRALHVGGYFDFSPLNFGNAADAAIRKFSSGDPALILGALTALEQKVAEAVAGSREGDELAARRFAAFKAAITNTDAERAIAAVEAQWRAEQAPPQAVAPSGEGRRGSAFRRV